MTWLEHLVGLTGMLFLGSLVRTLWLAVLWVKNTGDEQLEKCGGSLMLTLALATLFNAAGIALIVLTIRGS